MISPYNRNIKILTIFFYGTFFNYSLFIGLQRSNFYCSLSLSLSFFHHYPKLYHFNVYETGALEIKIFDFSNSKLQTTQMLITIVNTYI